MSPSVFGHCVFKRLAERCGATASRIVTRHAKRWAVELELNADSHSLFDQVCTCHRAEVHWKEDTRSSSSAAAMRTPWLCDATGGGHLGLHPFRLYGRCDEVVATHPKRFLLHEKLKDQATAGVRVHQSVARPHWKQRGVGARTEGVDRAREGVEARDEHQ